MKKLIAILLSIVCILSFAACDSGNANGEKGQNIKDFADYEALTYSLNKLSNADISFNFSFSEKTNDSSTNSDKSTDEKQKLNSTKSESNKVALLNDINEPQGEIMEFDIDEIQRLEDYDYFKEMENRLENQRTFARSVVNNAVNNITVLDKAIISENNTVSVLSYDKDNNTVYTILKNNQEIHEISIYYDSFGNETVEMTTISSSSVSNKGIHDITKLKYAPGENYYIANYQSGMVNVAMATKVDGEWQGLTYYFYEENSFLTKKGEYDLANGQVYVSFLVEKNGTFFTFSDHLEAYRDGIMQTQGVEAQETDVMKLKQNMFYSSFVNIDYYNKSIDFNYNSFSGIDKAHIKLESELGPSTGTQLIHFYYDNANDYLLLDNGNKIITNEVWTSETGETVTLCGGEAYLTSQENYDLKPTYPIRFEMSDETIGGKFATFKEFMNAKGFTVSKYFAPSVIDDLSSIEQNNETYRGKLFKKLFNKEYSEKNVIDEMLSNLSMFSAIESDMTAKIDGYETMNYEDMPKLSARPDLITISTSSKATINQKNLDLSAISISVDKNILLDSSSNYGIYVSFDNKTVSTSAFGTVQFADSSMTFNGSNLSDFINLDEGIYNLKLCFGKYVSETEFIPLSNEITVDLNSFSSYTYSTENDQTLGGHYDVTYSFENGKIKVLKQFVQA